MSGVKTIIYDRAYCTYLGALFRDELAPRGEIVILA